MANGLILGQQAGVTAASAISWLAAGLGVTIILAGLVSLALRRVVVPRLRWKVSWLPWAVGQLLMGSFLLLETVPRLLGASQPTVVLLTCLALAIEALGVATLVWANQRNRRRWPF